VIFRVQDSLKILPKAMVDVSVQNAAVYDKFQFERNGYFSVDPDSQPGQVGLLYINIILAILN